MWQGIGNDLAEVAATFIERKENDVALACKVPSVDLTLIRPKIQLTDDSLEFVPEKMREMMAKGYRRAKELAPQANK